MDQFTLTIAHNIFLESAQREELANGKTIRVVGSSLPVWIAKDQTAKKGFTTEPAKEVFCQYHITNNPKKIPVCRTKEGYQINLPQLPEDWKKPELSNDDWRKMSEKEKSVWYEKNRRPPCGEDLSGERGYLNWKEIGKEKMGNKTVDIINYITIDHKEKLETSIEQDC